MKTKMFKRLALALACVCAAPVYASEWQIFADTNGTNAYYFFDRATVLKQGGSVTLWIKYVQNLSKPDTDGSYATAMKEVYVCSKRTNQILSYSTYDKDGQFIKSKQNAGTVTDIAPDTIGEGIFKAVCSSDFPNNKSRKLYVPATNNDPFKHTADLFEYFRAQKTDLAPQ